MIWEECSAMAKATTTIQQTLNSKPASGACFAATQTLFNQVAAFYCSVIQAHERVVAFGNQEALTALKRLIHKIRNNPHPVLLLSEVAEDLPAIYADLGSVRSLATHRKKWRARKEKALAKGKPFTKRPPGLLQSWNKSVTIDAGQWKERPASSLMLKVQTGTTYWSWVKCRMTGRGLPRAASSGSFLGVKRGTAWWQHTPVERPFRSPAQAEEQITANAYTTICAVDVNLDGAIAVCTIQTAEGSTSATRIIGEGKQDYAALWRKIAHHDEAFARVHEACILVFEHPGRLKSEQGTYSRRGKSKRACWMKGRISRYATYKACNAGVLMCRVNPRNTCRECARCAGLVMRDAQGQSEAGDQVGVLLALCPACKMRGHADRNVSLRIGQRLIACDQSAPEPQPHHNERKSLTLLSHALRGP